MKRRIAILATHVGLVNRGAETFVIEVTKALRNHFDVTVFSAGDCAEIIDNVIKVDFKLPFWFNLHRNIYNKIVIYKKICNRLHTFIPSETEHYFFTKEVMKKFLLSEKYDLLFPNNGVMGAKAAAKIREMYGTPFIYTGHGGNSAGEIKILKTKPDVYIALTERYKRWAENFGSNIVKIHNGVSTAEFSERTEIKSEHKNLERPILLCTGAFDEMKRQKLLVDAFALLDRGFLIMLGTGKNRESIAEYCAKKIEGSYIIDNVDYRDIKYYYNLCDLFSLPSKDEPFGIVYLEAMSCNKPVVTTDDETRREIIGGAGILADVEDAGVYSAAIKKCCEKDWKNIPLERAKNNFDWDIISKKYIELIQGVMNENSKSI